MTKNPFSVNENMMASEVLTLMNKKKLLIYVYTIIKIKKGDWSSPHS